MEGTDRDAHKTHSSLTCHPRYRRGRGKTQVSPRARELAGFPSKPRYRPPRSSSPRCCATWLSKRFPSGRAAESGGSPRPAECCRVTRLGCEHGRLLSAVVSHAKNGTAKSRRALVVCGRRGRKRETPPEGQSASDGPVRTTQHQQSSQNGIFCFYSRWTHFFGRKNKVFLVKELLPSLTLPFRSVEGGKILQCSLQGKEAPQESNPLL